MITMTGFDTICAIIIADLQHILHFLNNNLLRMIGKDATMLFQWHCILIYEMHVIDLIKKKFSKDVLNWSKVA